VELFFKWIKQNLRIKHFFGTTDNAVKTQVWIAICVYVLVAIVPKELGLEMSLCRYHHVSLNDTHVQCINKKRSSLTDVIAGVRFVSVWAAEQISGGRFHLHCFLSPMPEHSVFG